jgi:uncharacterized membrane protein YozB (DUF420 family)
VKRIGELILVILMMEALFSSETLVLTTATLRNIPKDNILHSHCRKILESYVIFTVSLLEYLQTD